MLIEKLKDWYPLIYDEAKKIYEDPRYMRRYDPLTANIMDFGWSGTPDPDFWSTVYRMDVEPERVRRAMELRPDLFYLEDKPGFIVNNGFFK